MKSFMTCRVILTLFLAALLCGCGGKENVEIKISAPKANVEVTTIDNIKLNDTVSLIATSVYNNKTIVIAPIAGYLSEVNLKNGLDVRRGVKLFEMLTKEYYSIKTSKDILDSLNLGRKAGKIDIFAPSSGQISDLSTMPGQYVQEGSALCTIVDMTSLLFKLYVPLQYNSFIKPGMRCTFQMPDGQNINGTVRNLMAKTELNAQTMVYFVSPALGMKIPEGINVKTLFVNQKKSDTQVLSKEAVLSNETLSEFWVMKLINDSTAIKVPVKIGASNSEVIEIKEPLFSSEDRIITSGNYGLPDTALINITIPSDEK
jgi:multidrug efflux pump subunit AcrA (membrane-fusion protein)